MPGKTKIFINIAVLILQWTLQFKKAISFSLTWALMRFIFSDTICVPYLRTTPGTHLTKGAKMIPYLRIDNLKNHTLSGGTYLYSPYMGVHPPGVKHILRKPRASKGEGEGRERLGARKLRKRQGEGNEDIFLLPPPFPLSLPFPFPSPFEALGLISRDESNMAWLYHANRVTLTLTCDQAFFFNDA